MSNNGPKRCVITGAAGGIGRALVTVFCDAGYRVVALDCAPQPADLGGASYVRADLGRFARDEAYAQAALADIRASLGGQTLDALINNAAVQILGSAERLNRDDWHETLDVNVLAPFLLTQSLLPELEAARGCVLNIGSIHARLTKPGFSAYAASKAALAGLTRSLAVELGSRIRVNAIEPAAVDTPMLRAGFARDAAGLKALSALHPSGTIGTAEELGRLVRLLVEQKTMFANGTVVNFDGGIGARLHDPGWQP